MRSILNYLSEGKVKDHIKRNAGKYGLLGGVLGSAALAGGGIAALDNYQSNKEKTRYSLKKDIESEVEKAALRAKSGEPINKIMSDVNNKLYNYSDPMNSGLTWNHVN